MTAGAPLNETYTYNEIGNITSKNGQSYNSRAYDVGIGRFVAPDTIVPEAGKPQALNRYSYVYNNPMKFIDPSGHRMIEDTGVPEYDRYPVAPLPPPTSRISGPNPYTGVPSLDSGGAASPPPPAPSPVSTPMPAQAVAASSSRLGIGVSVGVSAIGQPDDRINQQLIDFAIAGDKLDLKLTGTTAAVTAGATIAAAPFGLAVPVLLACEAAYQPLSIFTTVLDVASVLAVWYADSRAGRNRFDVVPGSNSIQVAVGADTVMSAMTLVAGVAIREVFCSTAVDILQVKYDDEWSKPRHDYSLVVNVTW